MGRWLLGLVFLAAGCASGTGLGRARTLPPGSSRVGVVAEGSAYTANVPGGQATLPWLQLGVGYRRGVTERLDVGGSVHGFAVPEIATFGGSLDSKVMLRDGASGGLDAVLAPGVGYQQVRIEGYPWHFVGVSLPLLFGWNLGRHQVVFGPRFADQILAGGGRVVNLAYLGISAGVALRLGSSFDLQPEVLLLWSPVTFGGHDPDTRERGLAVLQIGIGGSYEF